MELDKALEYAVVLSWPDLLKVVAPVHVRIQYRRESEQPLELVSMWADRGRGYRDRICDYSIVESRHQPVGMHFWKGHDSEQLSETLSFIMKHQDRFTSSPGSRDRTILVAPPGDAEREQAAALRAEVSAAMAEPATATHPTKH